MSILEGFRLGLIEDLDVLCFTSILSCLVKLFRPNPKVSTAGVEVEIDSLSRCTDLDRTSVERVILLVLSGDKAMSAIGSFDHELGLSIVSGEGSWLSRSDAVLVQSVDV